MAETPGTPTESPRNAVGMSILGSSSGSGSIHCAGGRAAEGAACNWHRGARGPKRGVQLGKGNEREREQVLS